MRNEGTNHTRKMFYLLFLEKMNNLVLKYFLSLKFLTVCVPVPHSACTLTKPHLYVKGEACSDFHIMSPPPWVTLLFELLFWTISFIAQVISRWWFDQLMKIYLHYIPLKNQEIFNNTLGKRLRKGKKTFFFYGVGLFFPFIECSRYVPWNILYLTNPSFLSFRRAVSKKMLRVFANWKNPQKNLQLRNMHSLIEMFILKLQ